MNPTDILFQAFSGLTGGLIDDLNTAIVALVGLMILVIGFKKINSLLYDRCLDAALQNSYSKRHLDGLEGDIHRARYRKLISLKINRMKGDDC